MCLLLVFSLKSVRTAQSTPGGLTALSGQFYNTVLIDFTNHQWDKGRTGKQTSRWIQQNCVPVRVGFPSNNSAARSGSTRLAHGFLFFLKKFILIFFSLTSIFLPEVRYHNNLSNLIKYCLSHLHCEPPVSLERSQPLNQQQKKSVHHRWSRPSALTERGW